jgi:gamma-D-glutamyl-L-lysine dipeptidyl-peptidase
MKYGICSIAFIPMRVKAGETHEMSNQVLFGEHFTEIEKRGSWSKIILAHDNYEAWIDNKNIIYIDEELFNNINNSKKSVLKQNELTLKLHNDSEILLPIGSVLLHKKDFNIDKLPTIEEDENLVFNNSDIHNSIIECLHRFLNCPYLWGGRTKWGVDCSGLVQTIYRIHGINIPRDANQQVDLGENIEFITETKPGDIAFFDDKNGKIIHVGIITGPNEIIHASGRVKKDRLDHQGIFDNEYKFYTHNLRVIKRIIS